MASTITGELSLKNYVDELEAENKAKNNEIKLLHQEIERLEKANQGSSSVKVQNQSEKVLKIIELENSLRKLQTEKTREKATYERKIQTLERQVSNLKSNRGTTSYTSNRSPSETEIQDLKKTQTELTQKMEKLTQEKNAKIQELERNLAASKQETIKVRSEYGNRSSSMQVGSHQTNSPNEQVLKTRISELAQRNEDLQNKYNQILMGNSKSPSTQYLTITNPHLNYDLTPDKLAKENMQLYEKNQFLEKKISQLEDWNNTLKTQILMKMNTRTITSEPISLMNTGNAFTENITPNIPVTRNQLEVKNNSGENRSLSARNRVNIVYGSNLKGSLNPQYTAYSDNNPRQWQNANPANSYGLNLQQNSQYRQNPLQYGSNLNEQADNEGEIIKIKGDKKSQNVVSKFFGSIFGDKSEKNEKKK